MNAARLAARGAAALGLTAAALAPLVIEVAPAVRDRAGVRTVTDAVAACRATGLTGWELVDHATHLVHDHFATYSILNLWESPPRAFLNGRGYSNQYNGALLRVLRGLGFDVEPVRASRVRKDEDPWWRMAHTWLRVTFDGRTLDVCASDAANHPGEVNFVPVSRIHPMGRLTYLNANTGMVPFAAFEALQSLVLGRPIPRWAQRPFGERIRAT